MNQILKNKVYNELLNKLNIITNSPDFANSIEKQYQILENKRIDLYKQEINLNKNIKLYDTLIITLNCAKENNNIQIIEKLEKSKIAFDSIYNNIQNNLIKCQNKIKLVDNKLKISPQNYLITLRRNVKDKIIEAKKQCLDFIINKQKYLSSLDQSSNQAYELKKLIEYTSSKNILTSEKKQFIENVELYFINDILYLCDDSIYYMLINYFII